MAFFVAVTDSTIVYTALPSISEGLHFPASRVQWVVVAYLLTSGGLLLLAGRAADRFGRRRMFLTGVGLFTAMSLLCGLAWSSGVLVAARAFEGVGVAIMVPAALSLLMTAFPDGEERNKALAVWGSLAGMGATAGLLLGGPITQLLGWRWIFLVNVPVGLLVLGLAPSLLREGPRSGFIPRLDVAGGLTGTLALLALVFAIVDAPGHDGAPVRSLAFLAAAALLAAAFVRIERRAIAPLVPPRVLRSRTLVAGNIIVLAAGMSVDGLLYSFTVLAQQVLGYSAVEFGLTMAVMTLTSLLGLSAGQHFVSRVGVRPVAGVGLVLIGLSSTLLTQVTPDGGFVGSIFVSLVLFGPGMGATFVAGQIAALVGIAEHETGLASGIEETTFAIGGALGVVIASSIALSGADLFTGLRAAFAGPAAFAGLGLASLLILGPGVGARQPPSTTRS